jgi:hypothetical protein
VRCNFGGNSGGFVLAGAPAGLGTAFDLGLAPPQVVAQRRFQTLGAP